MTDCSARLYEPFFVARQPIFDRKDKVWGYELLFRDSHDAQTAIINNAANSTLKVVSSGFLCGEIEDNRKICINFPERLILDDVPYALPASSVVIEVLETVAPTQPVIDALTRLKQAGYLVAIDDYVGNPGSRPLLELADIVKVDILGQDEKRIAAILASVPGTSRRLLAEKVETLEVYTMTRNLGFDLFQGFYFSKPKTVPGRKLSSNEVSRLRLFKLIETDDIDIDELTDNIQADVAISYRLLRLLNSVAFGLRTQIRSIRHAITLLGWIQLKNWLRLIILTDMLPAGVTQELPFLAVQRGKFFELAARCAARSAGPPESMFLLGLFSPLEAMLGLPIEDIVANLPIDEEIKDALCRKRNDYYQWLEMAQAYETADWSFLQDTIARLGLDPHHVAQSYIESISWAGEFFSCVK